jgi:hypothetical protein
MKIEMLTSKPVAPDGINIQLWGKGSTHEVKKELGEMLVKAKIAKKISNPVVQTEEIKEVKEEKKKAKKK